MSNSILDKINSMTEEKKEETKTGKKNVGAFPFLVSISIIFSLILAGCVIVLAKRVSYDLNTFLDSYMILISAVMGSVLLLSAISAIAALAKGFKISKLLTIIFSFLGILLAIVPFVIPGLLYL